MVADRKKLYTILISTLVVLLLILLALGNTARIAAAGLLVASATIAWALLKKRPIPSIFSGQVLMLVGTSGVLYLMLYYLSGLWFGFTKTGYGLKLDILIRLAVPIATIIVTTELLRFVVRAQKSKLGDVLVYLICLAADVVTQSGLAGIQSFATFMDVVALTLFPGILYHLLYHYLSARYGYWPSLAYRLLTVVTFYLIPYGSAISDSLIALVNLFIPIGLYLFIDSLYEKKKKYALGNTNRWVRYASRALSVLVILIMLGTVMLVSNHFRYGALVIATESMTGELNRGDTALFEQCDDETIVKGQVIVFEKNNSKIIHRVIDIQIINGEYRYFTKGDANEDADAGYVTRAELVGVVRAKIPYIGYPTLWLRSLFAR